MPAHNGRLYGLFLSETAPANPSNPANYTTLLLLTTNGFNTVRNAIETSSKPDGDDSVFIAGRRNSNVPFTARFDHMDEASQKIIRDVINSAAGLLYFLVSANEVNAWQASGQAIVSARNVVEPDEAPGEINGTLQVTGAVLEETTPAFT